MRYYYDCPFKMAYMAKHFGMCFWNPELYSGDKIESEQMIQDLGEYIDSGSWGRCSFSEYLMNKQLYIHKDSLHLLEPQDDDLVLIRNDIGAWASFLSDDGKKHARIIYRDRIPFMWPEKAKE